MCDKNQPTNHVTDISYTRWCSACSGVQWCAVGPVSGESLLTCFVGARLDVLEPGALCQDAELTVAVLAIQLLGLTIADVLRGEAGGRPNRR